MVEHRKRARVAVRMTQLLVGNGTYPALMPAQALWAGGLGRCQTGGWPRLGNASGQHPLSSLLGQRN